ncbi:MAG TPA: hypothetical protein VE338_19360 [Ktedonobacterales bacterium]|nr:hypothetical protein [Ktedonobacterales bacterium]
MGDRITPDKIVADAAAAGLRVVEERALTSDQYLRVFERAD